MEITILMPCLNEAETLGACICKAKSWLNSNKIEGEVLIADNGSRDGSVEIANTLGARIINVQEKGYGAALMSGITHARGKYVIMGDSDDSYDFSDLDKFLEKLRQGYDLVMGNRFKGGIKEGAMPFLHRYLGNPVLSFLGRLFFKCDIGDFHCGLRGFKQNLAGQLMLQTSGMEFASEMVVKAALFSFRIAEVPTTLSPDGRTRRSHLRTWRDGWRHLRFLLMYSPKWLFQIPGIILVTLGIVFMALTIGGRFQIAKGVILDTNTLIFGGTFIILGFSCLSLGTFTRTFAIEEGFLPHNKRHEIFSRQFKLEIGIVIGLILLLLGVAGFIYAFVLWGDANFGQLVYAKILRIVVPSVVCLVLGCQTIFSSFFLSILQIKRLKKK
jgi:glycosyltransferase involved in cell wall biosynthesis